MKTNGAKRTEKVTEQNTEGVRIIQGVIRFLNLFLPITLAKRAAAMILIAAGATDGRVTGLTGLCDRSVRALRKALREGEPLQLLSIKKGSGRKSRTADVESEIFEELERSNYHTRQQVADMIEEKFHIKISVSAVGKLLKKGASKS